MYNIFCKDNNLGKSISGCFTGGEEKIEIEKYKINDFLKEIGNKKLQDFKNVLVFPDNFLTNKDKIKNKFILSFSENDIITTHNIMGFIGISDVNLTIGSRFDKDEDNQFFLQYMLQKVFALNLLNLQTTAGKENLWDFLLFYIFPYYLNKAFKQGVFKKYVRRQYNNSNVKGTIDVARHIRQNIPFMGKVAYNTREYSYDNPLSQLIRHTIEFIEATRFRNALSQNTETIDNLRLLKQLTPSYSSRERQKVVLQNLSAVRHPYFTEYEPLRKICLQILKYQGLAFRKSSERVYGVLFDGAWLWEEYLNVVFKEQNLGFTHPENNTGREKIYLFDKNEYDNKKGNKIMYPDFYRQNEIVIDAKYKHLERNNSEEVPGDYYQVITYMYRLKSSTGILLYPTTSQNNCETKFKMHKDSLGGNGSSFIKYGLAIPQNKEKFVQFNLKISESEEKLTKDLRNFNKKLETNKT